MDFIYSYTVTTIVTSYFIEVDTYYPVGSFVLRSIELFPAVY